MICHSYGLLSRQKAINLGSSFGVDNCSLTGLVLDVRSQAWEVIPVTFIDNPRNGLKGYFSAGSIFFWRKSM